MPNLLNGSDIHYVKFMRGSTAAWEALLATPEKISDDTLYFIYQDAATSTEGKLYLGTKLISGEGSGGSSGDINIADIGDVYIDDVTLADKQILVYNETTEQWENTPLSTIINTAVGVMQGATASTAGISGLVPVPHAGDQDKFLKGSGEWATINIPTFNTDVFSLTNNSVNLQGYNLAPIGSVPIKTSAGIQWTTAPAGRLNRTITTMEKLLAQLSGDDPDPIDPDTIYMVDNGNDDSTQNKYDEYMIINHKLERLGTFGTVDLTQYVKVSTYNTEVNKLENTLYDQTDPNTGLSVLGLVSRVTRIENNYVSKSQIGDLNQLLLSAGNSTLVDEVNTLHNGYSSLDERLKWQDLIDSSNNNE